MKTYLQIAIIVAAIVVVSAALWQIFFPDQADPQDQPPFNPVEQISEQPTGEEVGLALVADTGGEEEAPGGFAQRIVHVPGESPESPESRRPFDSEFHQSVMKMVESSLSGSNESAVVLSELVMQCLTEPEDEVLVQDRLDTSRSYFRPNAMIATARGWVKTFESFEAYEAFVWKQFDECRVAKSLFEDDLHERIALMAERGHVVARYLYAIWTPSAGEYRVDDIPKWLEYQDQALEYTWENVDEGEPLGLIAFGQSFRNSSPILFTPYNRNISQVFFLAAKKCGFESTWLDEQINGHMVMSRDPQANTPEQIRIQTDELRALFCD